MAISLNIFSQTPYDPCGEIRVRLSKVDELIVDEKYDQALEILEKLKKIPEMSDCENMRVVDHKINFIHNLQQKPQSNEPIIDFGCPDDNHPHAIDLGLPSGTKWACCNVGAKKPEDFGGYFAWGETEEKMDYKLLSYKYFKSSFNIKNIGTSINGTKYDVAYTNWGKAWQMPSKYIFEELFVNCTCEWFYLNGIIGILFTSKENGKSIFFPGAGNKTEDVLVNNCCSYWSSSLLSKERGGYALYLNVCNGDELYWDDNWCIRSYGNSVRPVSRY